MNYIASIRRLAGLCEVVQQVEDPDEEDRRDDERRQREAKITRVIAMAFKRIDLEIAEDGIYYDEVEGREAIIELDDTQVSLDHLTRLKQTGLANSYAIWAAKAMDGHVTLSVMFSVDPGLDNAVLS
jgi:hypothetical protein